MQCPACGTPNDGGKFCTSCGNALDAAPARPAVTRPIAIPDDPLAPEPVLQRSRGVRRSGPEAFLELQHSESVVLAAASRIFAAYVAAGEVTDDNQAAMEDRCVRAAMRLAVLTDRLVQSDDEEW